MCEDNEWDERERNTFEAMYRVLSTEKKSLNTEGSILTRSVSQLCFNLVPNFGKGLEGQVLKSIGQKLKKVKNNPP